MTQMALTERTGLVSIEGGIPAIGVESQLFRPSCLRSAEHGTGFAQGAQENLLVEPLTAREMEVLALICDGRSNHDVAKRLGIEIPTVKYHVYQIFGKLGVARRTQAVAVAVFLGMVRPVWLPPGAVRSALDQPPP